MTYLALAINKPKEKNEGANFSIGMSGMSSRCWEVKQRTLH